MAQWLERRTRDRKDSRSSPQQERRENVLLQGQLSVLTFIRYPFHLWVTAVARKRSHSFCQNCGWQVTAKHTCILCMWLRTTWHCKLVHCCMESRGTSHVTTKPRCNHLRWIFKPRCNHLQWIFKPRCNHLQWIFKPRCKHLQRIFKPCCNHLQWIFKPRCNHLQWIFKPRCNHLQ